MNRKYTNRRYLDALENKVLVFDGAMGDERAGLKPPAQHMEALRANQRVEFIRLSRTEAGTA